MLQIKHELTSGFVKYWPLETNSQIIRSHIYKMIESTTTRNKSQDNDEIQPPELIDIIKITNTIFAWYNIWAYK